MPLRNTPQADEELIEATSYYAAADWRKAVEFRNAFNAALARIDADPTSLPLYLDATDPHVPFLRIRGFPYVILFRTTDPAETVILAALHTAAGPGAVRAAERRD